MWGIVKEQPTLVWLYCLPFSTVAVRVYVRAIRTCIPGSPTVAVKSGSLKPHRCSRGCAGSAWGPVRTPLLPRPGPGRGACVAAPRSLVWWQRRSLGTIPESAKHKISLFSTPLMKPFFSFFGFFWVSFEALINWNRKIHTKKQVVGLIVHI